MSPLVCLLCLATFCVWGGGAQERTENLNNVDILEPIARVSPDPANSGDYFGWAAIFHPTEALIQGEPMSEALRKIRVIVGAPYGTFPGGLLGLIDYGETRLERVGLVYNCPVFDGTCLGVTGDTTLYENNATLFDNAGLRLPDATQVLPDEYAEGRLFDQAPNAMAFATNPDLAAAPNRDFEDKDGQILGAFLYSSRGGENFIACAPRWQLEFSPQDRNLARGICYASGRDLQGFTVQQPCSRDGPELDNNRGDSFCTAGHSATINNGYYVIGVPGIENNRGALAGRMIGDSSNPYTIGNFTSRDMDGNIIQETPPDPTTPQTDQYQGFRVINAWISNERDTPNESPDLVTTVPRASFDYTGRLHVYRADDLGELIFTHCTGSQMGEFFGYSIAAADLNGDGFDEVIVGAPMYTNYTSGRVEIGRVYIFSPSGGVLCPNPNHNATVLEGPRTSPGARFGMSVASVGDVDRDGYQDVIIGAPYLDNGDNSGAVFVYYGRANIEDIPNQVPLQITASTVAENSNFPSATLTTFGFSVSSGYDVDANGYNDVVIGAYRSQSVFVLRTLPVADVTITFVPRDTVDIDSQGSFNLEVTASFDGVGVADDIIVSFQIREVIRGGSPRVRFNQGLTESDFATAQFDFTGSIGKNTNVTAMVEVLTQSDITNLDPLEFAITLEPIPRTANPGSLTDLSPFPVLRAGGESTTQVTIVNFCGDDGCEADVFFASVTELIPVIANDPNPITAGITVRNKAGQEPALGLVVELTDLPAYVVSASIDTITCTSQGNDTTRRTCAFPQRRINAEQSFSASIEFGLDTSMLIGNEANSTVNLRLVIPDDNQNRDSDTSDNTASIILNPTAEAELRIERMAFSPSNPNYTRSAPSEALLLSDGINALMTEVTLEIAIRNEGPSTIQNGTLNVWLPVQDSTSSLYYLYPYQIRASGPNVVCNETGVDPERLVDQSNSGRRKRSLSERRALRRIAREAAAADFMPELSRRAKRQAQAPVIDCSSESMRDACLMLECSFSNLERDTISISFNTRLDERFYTTLQTEAERAMVFDLMAYATVELDNDYITGDNTTNNMDSATVIIRPVAPEVQQDFLHVILWPVLAGIIILIFLIIVLYFCGFFRRKKPGEGETEGDIDIEMPPGEGPAKAAYSPEKAEMEAENTVL